MASRRTAQPPGPEEPARLTVPKAQAENDIRHRVDAGIEIRDRSISSQAEVEAARRDYYIWDEYNDALLIRLFMNGSEQKRYEGSFGFGGAFGGSYTLREPRISKSKLTPEYAGLSHCLLDLISSR